MEGFSARETRAVHAVTGRGSASLGKSAQLCFPFSRGIARRERKLIEGLSVHDCARVRAFLQ